jgi:uncharacterized protein (TIGR00730 family)
MSETEELRKKMAEVMEQYLQLDTALRKAQHHHFRVCLFGSARIQPNDAIYNMVYDLAGKLAHMGIDIVTGGGPGLMEAANRAVRDAKVKGSWSYGLPLNIPGLKEVANAHLDIKSMHSRFSSRLDEFMRLTDGVIVAPGGIGTILELFYVWQLLQLAMVDSRPVVLLESRFWEGLIDWMRDSALRHRLVSAEDLNYIHLADTPDEAIALIEPAYRRYLAERRIERKAAREKSLGEKIRAAKRAQAVSLTLAGAEAKLSEAARQGASEVHPPDYEPEGPAAGPAETIVTPTEAKTQEMRQSNRRPARPRQIGKSAFSRRNGPKPPRSAG